MRRKQNRSKKIPFWMIEKSYGNILVCPITDFNGGYASCDIDELSITLKRMNKEDK